MKRTLRGVYATLILAVSLFAFAACSSGDDTDGGETPKEFPTFTDLKVAPNDLGSIEFTAYTTWTLSSDKPTWFKLDASTGKAGAQKVNYSVTDDGMNFTDDVATITFAMDGKTVVFKATRSSKEREIKFFVRIMGEGDLEYKEVTSIDMVYQANANTYLANFAVVANFDWKITSPEWVSIEQDDMSGDANVGADTDPSKLSYKWARIDLSKATLANMAGDLIFTDRAASDQSAKLGVTCPGSKEYMMHDATFEVKLNSAGGYTPSQGDPKEYYSFKVIAGNDGVETYKIAKKGDYYGVDNNGTMVYKATWCQTFESETAATVLGPGVKETGYDLSARENWDAERSATVLMIPTSVVEAKGITNEKDLITDDEKAIKPEYEQYIITEVTQSGVAAEIVFATGTPEGVTLEKLESGDDYDFVHSEYSVDLVYQVVYNSFAQMNNCLFNYNGYTGEGNLEVLYNPSDNENTGSKGWIKLEVNGGQYMSFDISDANVPFTGERYTWVIVKDKDTFKNEFAIKVIQKVAR